MADQLPRGPEAGAGDRDAAHAIQPDLGGAAQFDLPALGYPYSEQALTEWFRQTYGRTPSERELGVLMDAMAQRDGTLPNRGPQPDPQGWRTAPSPAPGNQAISDNAAEDTKYER